MSRPFTLILLVPGIAAIDSARLSYCAACRPCPYALRVLAERNRVTPLDSMGPQRYAGIYTQGLQGLGIGGLAV
jgi:hypothetical protein